MSVDPRSADANRARQEATDAKINEAIAEDVAVGMAEKADHERAKANIYATQAAHKADVAAVEQHNRQLAQQESRQTKFTLWLVLGILAIGTIAALAWALNRPAPTDNTTTVVVPGRPAAASPTPGPGMLMSNPNNGVPVVPPPARPAQVQPAQVQPAQAAPPAQTAPPVIVVPVPVERQAVPPAAEPAAPRVSTPAPDPAPANPSSNPPSGGTLEGYVEPTKP